MKQGVAAGNVVRFLAAAAAWLVASSGTAEDSTANASLPDHLSVTLFPDRPGVCAVAFVSFDTIPIMVNGHPVLCRLAGIDRGPEAGYVEDLNAGWAVAYGVVRLKLADFAQGYGVEPAALGAAMAKLSLATGPAPFVRLPVAGEAARPSRISAGDGGESPEKTVARFMALLADGVKGGTIRFQERKVEAPVWRKGPVRWSIRHEPAPPR